MVVHVVCSFVWLCVVMCGCTWLSIVLRGFAWFREVLCGFAWFCIILNDLYDSHDVLFLQSCEVL